MWKLKIIYVLLNLCLLISCGNDTLVKKTKNDDLYAHEKKFDRKNAVALSSLVTDKIDGLAKDKHNELKVDLLIPAGVVAYLDKSLNVSSITIKGELHCDQDSADDLIELKVYFLMINQGVFQCGTNTKPYLKKFIISLKDHPTIKPPNHMYRGIVVNNGGQLILNGSLRKSGWVKLKETAKVGDQYIVVDQKTGIESFPVPSPASTSFSKISNASSLDVPKKKSKFSIGDEIVIGPTGYNYEEAEKFKIIQIDPLNFNKLYLDKTIKYQHWGEKEELISLSRGKINLDERAEVANLTRSIVIQAEEKNDEVDVSELGGHVMVHASGKAFISAVEFFKMGQAGIMGRYPFHWHLSGNVDSQYIRNSSIHSSFQRCVVIHRTDYARVQNNVCYDFKGHGYFLEDGNEIKNKIIRNLAIKAKHPSSGKVLLHSEHPEHSESSGRFPSVSSFWISNPQNTVMFNVSSGSVGTGFWMSFEDEVKDPSTGELLATPRTENTDAFNYNVAHASEVGMSWDGARNWQNANNPNNPNDRLLSSSHYRPGTTPYFKGLVVYKNYLTGIYFRGQTVVFENTILADNGWSAWVNANQVFYKSSFVGKTLNHFDEMDDFFYSHPRMRAGRYRRTGAVIYDGPLEVHDSDFFNFSIEPQEYTLENGLTRNSTYVPFTATGGSTKYTNFVSGLHFSPDPIHRIHLKDPVLRDFNNFLDTNWRERSFLGITTIRDLDGSLVGNSGGEQMIVSNQSLGLIDNYQCSDGGERLHNFVVCEKNYNDGIIYFRRESYWTTPFVVRRSDGVFNYPMESWQDVKGNFPNNSFAVADDEELTYELLPNREYHYPFANLNRAVMSFNAEKETFKGPIVKILSYGKNCRLENGAENIIDAVPEKVASVAALKEATQTSYVSIGNDLYVKIFTTQKNGNISDDSVFFAKARRHGGNYRITCDDEEIDKVVKGVVENIEKTDSHTIVTGWACNERVTSSIKVVLYVVDNQNEVTKVISEVQSNEASEPEIAMKCGSLTDNGRRYTFSIPNEELIGLEGGSFKVRGISQTDEPSRFLRGLVNYIIE